MKVTGSSMDSGQKADKYLGPHSPNIFWRVVLGLRDSWIRSGAELQPRDLDSSFSCIRHGSNTEWLP